MPPLLTCNIGKSKYDPLKVFMQSAVKKEVLNAFRISKKGNAFYDSRNRTLLQRTQPGVPAGQS